MPPCLQVLVEAHSACAPTWGEEAPDSSSAASGNAWCAVPSEMLARIWLLATSTGLSAADIVELWRQESQFFKFKASNARHTIGCIASACAWLRGLGLSAEEVSAVWNAQMRMFIFPGDTLATGLRALQRRCTLSAEQQRAFLLRAGRYLTPLALQPLLSKVDAIITAAPGAQPYLAQLLSSGGEGLLDELDLALRKVADLRKYGALGRRAVLWVGGLQRHQQQGFAARCMSLCVRRAMHPRMLCPPGVKVAMVTASRTARHAASHPCTRPASCVSCGWAG